MIKNKISLILTLSMLGWWCFGINPDSSEAKTLKNSTSGVKVSTVSTVKSSKKTTVRKHKVTATYYNPVESQCDTNPLVTADNSKINMKRLRKDAIRWIAISRDLLDYYQLGDVVIVKSDNPRINGEWEIHDVMNSRFTNRIDFLLHPKDTYYGIYNPMEVTITKKV